MKKILLCALVSLITFTCVAQQKNTNLKISGDIIGLNKGEVELYIAPEFQVKA